MVDVINNAMQQKIFAIGLPRCGGQTLQSALAILFRRCVHSPGNDWAIFDRNRCFSEVYVHPDTLVDRYGVGNCLFLLNVREVDSWLESCRSVYQNGARWNHPIWRYPLEGFMGYRTRYLESRMGAIEPEHVLNIVELPRWDELCRALGVPIPNFPFPRVDRHRARALGPSERPCARSTP